MGKVSEHTTKYKVQSRNLLTKFRKEKRTVISKWGGG